MQEHEFTRITIQNSHTTSYHSEQETAEWCQLEVQIIRHLTAAGVIKGANVVGEEQRYSDEDITLLRRAHRLYHDLGVNLEGIEAILRLYAYIEALEHELVQYRRNTRS